MSQIVKKMKIPGIYTYRDFYSEIVDGALRQAKNINIDKTNVATPRRGYEKVIINEPGEPIDSFSDYKEKLFWHSDVNLRYGTMGSGIITDVTDVSSDVEEFEDNPINYGKQNSNLYLTSTKGVRKLDSLAGSLLEAGAPRGINMDLSLNASIGGFLDNGNEVSYRVTWGYKDANDNLIIGSPSQREVIFNDLVTNRDVDLTIYIPAGVQDGWFFQVYRTKESTGANTSGDTMFLVYEQTVDSTDISTGSVSFTDVTEDDLQGAPLYTNSTQEGIQNANDRPPACRCLDSYQNHMFYGNTKTKHTANVTLLDNLTGGDTITYRVDDGSTITTTILTAGTDFAVGTGATPSEQIDDCARNIVNAVNDQSTGVPDLIAFYVSAADDTPGKITYQIEENFDFTFTVQSSAGTDWSPDLTNEFASTNERKRNRLYFSKLQEPEAVPAINFFDVGDEDEPIIELRSLRDKLVIIKANSQWKITGSNISNFTLKLIDSTTKIVGSETVYELANRIFCLSNQGEIAITDGVQITSRRIFDQTETAESTSHACAQEENGRYVLVVKRSGQNDQIIAYNIFNDLFTEWELEGQTVSSYAIDDQIVFGDSESESIYVERTSGDSLDYSDSSSARTVTDITGDVFTLTDVSGLEVGNTLTEDSGDGVVRIDSIDSDNDTITVTYLEVPTNTSPVSEPYTAYQNIDIIMQWWPISMGSVENYKNFLEMAFIFEKPIYTLFSVDFSTDEVRIPSTVEIEDTTKTNEGWGFFPWGEISWPDSVATDQNVNETRIKRIFIPFIHGRGHVLNVTLNLSASNILWEFSGISLKADMVAFTPNRGE